MISIQSYYGTVLYLYHANREPFPKRLILNLNDFPSVPLPKMDIHILHQAIL